MNESVRKNKVEKQVLNDNGLALGCNYVKVNNTEQRISLYLCSSLISMDQTTFF